MDKKNFNETHPELREGEMWLTNISPNYYFEPASEGEPFGAMIMSIDDFSDALMKNFHQIGWSSKRLGECGYNIDGKPNELRPVFVKKEELIKAGAFKDKK